MQKRRILAFVFVCFFPVIACSAETVLFEEPFREKLKDGWAWLREVPNDWRIKENTLEVKMEPLPQSGARNILYRKPPKKAEGTFFVSVDVDTTKPFSNQYQQGGLYWMQNDDLKFKFVMERIDGSLYVFPGKVPIESEHVVLRLRIDDRQVVAEFQPNGKGEFRKAHEATLPERNDETDRIALQCWHGPAQTEAETWIKFSKFSITKPDTARPGGLNRVD